MPAPALPLSLCRSAGFNIDADKGVLEIGGHNLPDRGQKRLYLAHIRANPYAAFVVDGPGDPIPRGPLAASRRAAGWRELDGKREALRSLSWRMLRKSLQGRPRSTICQRTMQKPCRSEIGR